MIWAKREFYVVEERVLTREAAELKDAAGLKDVTTRTAPLRNLRYRWDYGGVEFERDGVLVLRRNFKTFCDFGAAKMHFEHRKALERRAGPSPHGDVFELHLWLAEGWSKVSAWRRVARGDAVLLAN